MFDSVPMLRCEFCGSRMVRWIYETADRDWPACDRCHAAIEADDREALLDRANQIPVPRTLPERYSDKFLERARGLHVGFWETRWGEPRRAQAKSRSYLSRCRQPLMKHQRYASASVIPSRHTSQKTAGPNTPATASATPSASKNSTGRV
jgi:hypothetical protein